MLIAIQPGFGQIPVQGSTAKDALVKKTGFHEVLAALKETGQQQSNEELAAVLSGVLSAYLLQQPIELPQPGAENPDMVPVNAKTVSEQASAVSQVMSPFEAETGAPHTLTLMQSEFSAWQGAASTEAGLACQQALQSKSNGLEKPLTATQVNVLSPKIVKNTPATSPLTAQQPVQPADAATPGAAVPVEPHGEAAATGQNSDNEFLKAVKSQVKTAEPAKAEAEESPILWLNQNLRAIKVASYQPTAPEASSAQRTTTQIIESIIAHPLKDGQEFEIQLYPKELGKVQIKMTVEQESVKLMITCQEKSTQEALINGFPKLSTVLTKEMGVQVSVEFYQAHDAMTGQQFGGGGHRGQAEYRQPIATAEDNFENYINQMIEQSFFVV